MQLLGALVFCVTAIFLAALAGSAAGIAINPRLRISGSGDVDF